MSDRPVFLYAAIYDDIADAELDYEAVFDLHAAGAIGTFDSAVIRKEADGKVRVTKTEKRYVQLLNLAFNLYEYDYLPLRKMASPRFVANWARRWREPLLYVRLAVRLARGRTLR